MKRNLIEKFSGFNKKLLMCLMIGSLAFLNTGFTDKAKATTLKESVAIQTEKSNASVEKDTLIDKDGNKEITKEHMAKTLGQVVEETMVQYNEMIEREKEAQAAQQVSTVQEIQEPVGNVVDTGYGALPYSYAIDMEATAYLPSDGGGSGITATGIQATYGVVAVDPGVIPLGTRVYIPGYGEALAADTGGAIYGNRIDLCMESYNEAMQFGRRTVTVFVLE